MPRAVGNITLLPQPPPVLGARGTRVCKVALGTPWQGWWSIWHRRISRAHDGAGKGLGSFCISLCCCYPAWVLAASQGRHWQPKIISGRLGKALVSSLPLPLNKATIRASLTNFCSQLMFLLRKFSEIPVLYSLRSVNSEHTLMNFYVNHVCPKCSSHGTSFQALGAVDAQTLTQHHLVHH